MIQYKVNYNMNAIREPSELMEGDLLPIPYKSYYFQI